LLTIKPNFVGIFDPFPIFVVYSTDKENNTHCGGTQAWKIYATSEYLNGASSAGKSP